MNHGSTFRLIHGEPLGATFLDAECQWRPRRPLCFPLCGREALAPQLCLCGLRFRV